jgi:hypothetical protein
MMKIKGGGTRHANLIANVIHKGNKLNIVFVKAKGTGVVLIVVTAVRGTSMLVKHEILLVVLFLKVSRATCFPKCDTTRPASSATSSNLRTGSED